MGAYTIGHDRIVTMAYTRMRTADIRTECWHLPVLVSSQFDQNVTGARLGRLNVLDGNSILAWVGVHTSFVLPRDFWGSHFFSRAAGKSMSDLSSVKPESHEKRGPGRQTRGSLSINTSRAAHIGPWLPTGQSWSRPRPFITHNGRASHLGMRGKQLVLSSTCLYGCSLAHQSSLSESAEIAWRGKSTGDLGGVPTLQSHPAIR